MSRNLSMRQFLDECHAAIKFGQDCLISPGWKRDLQFFTPLVPGNARNRRLAMRRKKYVLSHSL